MHEEHKHCGCGHDHHGESGCHHEEGCGCHHEDGCGCGHAHPEKGEIRQLLLGAGLFVLGMVLSLFRLELIAGAVHVAAWLVLGWEVLMAAAKNLGKGHILDENFLMSIATIGAFLIGEIPEAVGVMLFYRVGEYFEHRAMDHSRKQIMAAVDLRPETVTLEDGTVIPASQAKPGDVLLVRPGDRIPLDGQVRRGESRVDTAPVTGESLPVAVKPGSPVISGCVNQTALLTVVATKPLGESMVTKILQSVEHAAAWKPKMDRFLTRFSRIYTPVVVGIAAATAIIPSVFTGNWGYWVYTALSFLVMSCPCALVLSVPLAFFSGIGVASRQGILFKGGASMEALAQVKVAAMDKTGTLTKGDFQVQAVSGDVLALCAACEAASSHPIARSICAGAEGLALPKAEAVQELAGMGIQAVVEGKQVLCGSRALLKSRGVAAPKVDGTVVYVAADGAYLGHILLGDTVKPETPAAVARLKKLGVDSVMLTGDKADTARAVAENVGINRVFSGLLPQEKLQIMEQLRRENGQVLFVGDGINDAPVLSGADVGAVMGSGADAAIEAADVVFLSARADAIPQAVALARRTRAIAWQNVVFALGIKAAVMVLGLLGFANMWLAVFADSGVAMLCVLNAVRMLYRKRGE